MRPRPRLRVRCVARWRAWSSPSVPRLLGTVGVSARRACRAPCFRGSCSPVLLGARGAIGPVRAAVLSGAAVVCMGGVNAVEVIGSLPMPLLIALWVTWRRLLPARFLAWWVGAVAVACTWWLLPLLTLGRFSPPFYEYVESASNTTGVIGWSEALRGGSHWVAYITAGGRGWWPAAYAYAFEPLLIAVSAAVAAIGPGRPGPLPRHPCGCPLVAGAAVGLAALTVAHGGWEGSPPGRPRSWMPSRVPSGLPQRAQGGPDGPASRSPWGSPARWPRRRRCCATAPGRPGGRPCGRTW